MAESEVSPYALGQDDELTELFGLRTAEIEGNFVLPYIRPNSRILDVGSGPGSITCDFAGFANKGQVVGVDLSPVAVENAQKLARQRGVSNVKFTTGDILKRLPFEDDTFDVIYSHQMLTFLADPLAALKEMKRVTRPGGVIASRDIIGNFWFPSTPQLANFVPYISKAIHLSGAKDSCIGSKLPIYAREAGLKQVSGASRLSGQAFLLPEEKGPVARLVRVLHGKGGRFRPYLVESGVPVEELDEMIADLDKWEANPDGWMSWVSLEMLCEVL